MAQSKKRQKSSRKTRTQKSQAQTVNQDLAAQQVLAQTVVETVTKQQDRIKELEAQLASKTAELEAAPKSVESAPQLALEPSEANKAMVEYLEKDILPRARQQSFAGAVPVMKNGKLESRNITSVKQLEDLIQELKDGTAQSAVASVSQNSMPATGFMTKLRKLVGG